MFPKQAKRVLSRIKSGNPPTSLKNFSFGAAELLRLVKIAFRLRRGIKPTFTSPKKALGNPQTYSFQMSSAYSRMVRSDENFPIRAVLRIAIFAQRFLSINAFPTSACISQYA